MVLMYAQLKLDVIGPHTDANGRVCEVLEEFLTPSCSKTYYVNVPYFRIGTYVSAKRVKEITEEEYNNLRILENL